ncbi:helix-turn-helix domain-containing protein [Zavarzinella formosa]|uniref:helix-turn-helix domain-containing protein n=1 Tax=Zavarzinella formosa TaxID=360055 RepID=UPI00030A0C92|nr:helix-turn-helix domain-containing protein [Zavarzinella formosa]
MKLYQSLLALIAGMTDRELAKIMQYLKAENRILCDRLPERILVTPKEKRKLLRFGKPLGGMIRQLITIVSPRTFLRWANQEKKDGGGLRGQTAKKRPPGRPRLGEEVQELIIRIALETGMGAGKILGELKKLGFDSVCRSTISAILREHGLEPGPDRSEGSWSDFIRIHASTLWACDFFTKTSWTILGPVTHYVLLFIQIETRKIHIAGITTNPDGSWMKQQARNLGMFFADQSQKPTHLILDNDTKFTVGFSHILESEGIELIRTAIMPRIKTPLPNEPSRPYRQTRVP